MLEAMSVSAGAVVVDEVKRLRRRTDSIVREVILRWEEALLEAAKDLRPPRTCLVPVNMPRHKSTTEIGNTLNQLFFEMISSIYGHRRRCITKVQRDGGR